MSNSLSNYVTADDTPVRQVQVIAHRGASGYLPEHTLEAKALAHGMGADFIEQDLVLTSDNVPILLHDIHLDGVTNVREVFPDRKRNDGRYYAIDFSLAEIKQLFVYERFHHQSQAVVYPNRYPAQTGNFQIPTLEEELQLIQGLNHSRRMNVGIYPELKAPAFHHQHGKDLAGIVLTILKKYGYASSKDRAIMQCFEFKETRRLKEELGCELFIVQLLGSEEWLTPETPRDVLRENLEGIATYAQGIGPAINNTFTREENGQIKPTLLIEEAHRAGLVVHAYTYRIDAISKPFDSFDHMHQLSVQSGIDGMFSDFPDLTVKLLNTPR